MAAGAHPGRTPLGSLQRSPHPLAGIVDTVQHTRITTTKINYLIKLFNYINSTFLKTFRSCTCLIPFIGDLGMLLLSIAYSYIYRVPLLMIVSGKREIETGV